MAFIRVSLIVAAIAIWYVWPEPLVHSIAGKTALVTGASSGLGVHIATALAKEGVTKLAICARRKGKLGLVRDQIIEEFPSVNVFAFECDVGNSSSRDILARNVLEEFGHLDILVNNAAVEKFFHFEKDTPESIDQQLNINCVGSIQLTRALLPQMIEQKKGHVVMMSSGAGKMGTPYAAVYSANRFCTKGFAAALRGEMRHRQTGVTVHSLHPGFVEDSGMWANYQSDAKAAGLQVAKPHWTYGSAGTAADTAREVIQLIVTDYPEKIVNWPDLRPAIVVQEIFPKMFDTLLAVWPDSMAFLADWAQVRVDEQITSDTLHSRN
jgi:short-subunit dehydrogenase